MKNWSKARIFPFTWKNIIKEGILQTQRNLSLDIINDGRQNNFPQWWTDIIYQSTIASACYGRLIDFIGGRDLHPDVKDLVVNEETGETFKGMHNALVKDYGIIDRFGIELIPRNNGSLASAKHIPMEWIRYQDYKGDIPDIEYVKVNPYVATREQYWNNNQIKTLRLFASLDKMNGEVNCLFLNETSPRNRIYSRPESISAANAIQTEAQMWEFHTKNAQNNFFLGGFLFMTGDPDQRITVTDENGNEQNYTVGEMMEAQLADSLSGSENAGRIAIFWQNNPDAPTPTFERLEANRNDEMFTRLYVDLITAITTATGVPQILLPIAQAGRLGESQEIRLAIKFLNERTAKKRKTLEAAYRKILPGFGVNIPEDEVIIEPIADISDLPQYVFNSLSENQKENYLSENFGISIDEDEIRQDEEAVNMEIEQLINQNVNPGNNN